MISKFIEDAFNQSVYVTFKEGSISDVREAMPQLWKLSKYGSTELQ